ncbi:hypothetical protein [Roseivivax jejudonensis]|uniref:hypothetical protein n=1 Tax=Roseivivax jejudonensis TaxID=1529041 RepID=UPI00135647E9|nr:hypothetical protein [Roseivivax jejudonensis]
MTRAPARQTSDSSDLSQVDAAVLALARLLGEAAAHEACLDTSPIEDDANATKAP